LPGVGLRRPATAANRTVAVHANLGRAGVALGDGLGNLVGEPVANEVVAADVVKQLHEPVGIARHGLPITTRYSGSRSRLAPARKPGVSTSCHSMSASPSRRTSTSVCHAVTC